MRRPGTRARSGFTLAEAAITIALVALTLSTVLQILQGSKFTTAHTRDMRRARDLALTTLGEIESGLWWDFIDSTRSGSYVAQELPDFYFELAVGDEGFYEDDEVDENGRPFDNWAYKRDLELEDYDSEEEEATEPFEKIRIRVTFPKYGELPNEIVLERWIPWEQVYGEPEVEAEDATSSDDPGADPPSTTGSPGSTTGGADPTGGGR